MSRWIRGIYNAAANFNLSNALRATRVGGVDRDKQHLSENSDKRDQHVESCESSKSGDASTTSSTRAAASCARTTSASSGTSCASAASCFDTDTVIIGNDVVITVNSEFITAADYIEREYAEYTATVNAQREGNSTGVWVSDEPRDFKHSDNAARTNVEHITGIPTGVTV